MCPPLLSANLRFISKSIRRRLLAMTCKIRASLPENTRSVIRTEHLYVQCSNEFRLKADSVTFDT
jgi:hypothetical protein